MNLKSAVAHRLLVQSCWAGSICSVAVPYDQFQSTSSCTLSTCQANRAYQGALAQPFLSISTRNKTWWACSLTTCTHANPQLGHCFLSLLTHHGPYIKGFLCRVD